MKNSFFLVIPQQRVDSERERLFEDTFLQRWIAELPAANPGLTIKLMHDLLEELIALDMDAQFRLNALERLRPNFLISQEFMRMRLMKDGFPKGRNELKTLEVLVEMEKAFAIGYWIVVKIMSRHKGVSWFKGKSLALALQRVIRGLSEVVISHYMMALPIPDWVWIDLHSLYRLSVRLNQDNTKVADDSAVFSKISTPRESYLQIILLSLAEPSGLMQREVVQVFQFTEKLAPLLSLQSKPVTDQTSQCVILMDEDKPPFWSHEKERHEDSHIMHLDLSKLHKAFIQEEKFVDSNDARFSSLTQAKTKLEKISPELFDYLESKWTGMETKSSVLFADRMSRLFTIGLDAAFELQSSPQANEETEIEYVAESASESSLSCQFQKNGILSIGSLISFRKAADPEHKRSLGVVSKIPLTKADGKVEFEVKPLALQAFAVNYLPINADRDDPPKKAFIFGIKDGPDEKRYLVVETFMFKGDDVLRLFLGGESFPIILRERKNVGLGYWQFECRRLPEQYAQKVDKSKRGYDFI